MKLSSTRPDVCGMRKYTVSEACEVLKISRTTLWRLRKESELNFKRDNKGGWLYILGKDLIKFWASIRMEN